MNKADLVVLGFLNRKPMYGYEIANFSEKHGLFQFMEVTMPSIYKSLQRLQEDGYIEGEYKLNGHNPPRKVFKISATGKEYFRKNLREYMATETDNTLNFWMSIRFINKSIDKDFFDKILLERKAKVEDTLQCMQARIKKMKQEGKFAELPFYVEIMLDRIKKIRKIELETLQELQEAASKPENKNTFLDRE
jgi:PadR family transcriptional regulator PadR